MKYILKTTKQYAKQLKKCLKRGCDESKLEYDDDDLILLLLQTGTHSYIF